MDNWSILPAIFDKYLKNNDFYNNNLGSFLGGSASHLPIGVTFRDRFTAAFLRYLKQINRTPEEAIEPFGRSWRHFQRYLVGGDQTPKMDVVVALAIASGVPVEWILGTTGQRLGERTKALADVEMIDFHCAQPHRPALLEELGLIAHLPASVLQSVRLEAPSVKLVVVHGSDATTPFREGDMLLLDISHGAKAVPPEGGVYLLKLADAVYLQKIMPRNTGICLSDEGEHGGSNRICSDPDAIDIIGRAVWIGRTL